MTFAQLCNDAYARCLRAAHPYVPSRAQLEEFLQPVVDALEQRPDGPDYIRATYDHCGLMPLALQMYKRARTDVPPRG